MATKKRPAKKAAPVKRSNLSLRNLNDRHLKILDRIKQRHRVGTNAGAIAVAILAWDKLQEDAEQLRTRLETAEDLVADYVKATKRGAEVMVEEEAALTALVEFDKSTDAEGRTFRRRL